MNNALTWFEIAAVDLERATEFYSEIFAVKMVAMPTSEGFSMSAFPANKGTVGGGIVQGDGYVPSANGTIVYLNGGDDLNVVLNRVAGAGGKVVLPKTDIGENGFMAYFIDSEGNKMGLHSMA